MKSKNQLRREKRKQKRQEGLIQASSADKSIPGTAEIAVVSNSSTDVQTEKPQSEPKATPKSSVTMLARRFDWVTESSPLYDLYQQVSARFKRPRDLTQGPQDAESDDRGGASESEDQHNNEFTELKEHVSNKKRRKEQKPSLADLKKLTRRPELIEWYDADAADPELLVYLKSLPHAVQVPSNWRNRTDSPNFPPQPPYELPTNVADTGIMDMRDPNSVDANTKPGRLDVDYERMYSAFFEHRPVPQLTAYGQVRDPKLRTLAFKPRRGPSVPQFSPGSISARLREALGLGPDDEVPWAEALKKQGPPPGYRQREQPSFKLWGSA